MPMTPAIPMEVLEGPRFPSLRVGIGVSVGALMIATAFLTGSSREAIDPAVSEAMASPPARAEAPVPIEAPREPVRPQIEAPPPAPPKVETTRSDVRRQLYQLSKLMRRLDGTAVPKEQLGPLWRDLVAAKKSFEAKESDLAELARRLTALEAEARALLDIAPRSI